MGSGRFGFHTKKDKVHKKALQKIEVVSEKHDTAQSNDKKTEIHEKQKTEKETKEKNIWWNQCGSCKFLYMN